MSSTCGSTAMARAMQSRCCCPPERPMPGLFSRSSTSPHRLAARSDFSTMSSASLLESFLLFSRMPATTFS